MTLDLRRAIFALFDEAESLVPDVVSKAHCLCREPVERLDHIPELALRDIWYLDDHGQSYIALRDEVSNLGAILQAFRRRDDNGPTRTSTRAYYFDTTVLTRRDLMTLQATMIEVILNLRAYISDFFVNAEDSRRLDRIKALIVTLLTRLRHSGYQAKHNRLLMASF